MLPQRAQGGPPRFLRNDFVTGSGIIDGGEDCKSVFSFLQDTNEKRIKTKKYKYFFVCFVDNICNHPQAICIVG
jgi:hypothetical protein